MPDRIIRDELLSSERYCSVTTEAKLLFLHLLLCCDDFGNFTGKNFSVRARCFPGEAILPERLDKWLQELHDNDLLRFYPHPEVPEERLIHIPRFRQRLRTMRPKFPLSPWTTEDEQSHIDQALTNRNVRQMSDSSQTPDRQLREKGSEVKGSEGKKTNFMTPTVDEVRAYAQQHGYQVNPEKFVAHYESNGWMVGKNRMKSWQATVRTWHQTALERKGSDPSSNTPTYL